jgi:Tol biopolymer transport system component
MRGGITRQSIWPVLLAGLALLIVGPPAQAAFSGANGKIGFSAVATPFGDNTLFAVNPDGTDLAAIPGGFSHYISWSPDGRRIAFATPPESGVFNEIYVMNADGTGLRRLTFHEGTDETPSWSPDGARIVWQRQCRVYVMNADGSGQTNLTDGNCTHGSGDFDPTWSPDGTRIAFVSDRAGDYDIFAMNADGSEPVNLTDHPADDTDPSWSPDGTKLAFITIRGDPFRPQLYIMDADGQNQVRVTNISDIDPLHAAWSPDGTRIAFIGVGPFPNFIYDVYTVSIDGSDVRQVTDTDAFKTDLDWQPIVGPQRSDYKNAAKFCKAERDFLGDAAFTETYGTHGGCVSRSH